MISLREEQHLVFAALIHDKVEKLLATTFHLQCCTRILYIAGGNRNLYLIVSS